MRIEHQGYIEVQPTYQHVGYISAAVENMQPTLVPLGLASASFCVVAAILIARMSRTWVGRGIAIAIPVIGLMGYAAWAADVTAHAQRRVAWIVSSIPLVELEAACELGDTWAHGLGRPATPKEWEGRMGRHGWPAHAGLRYEPLNRAGPDGRSFRITRIVPPNTKWPPGVATEVPSAWLGRDGEYGTPDDAPPLIELLGQLKWDNTYQPHGRRARAPKAGPP